MTKLNYEIPKHGEFNELRKDLYWTQFELPFRLNHVNLFFLNTKNGWVLISDAVKAPVPELAPFPAGLIGDASEVGTTVVQPVEAAVEGEVLVAETAADSMLEDDSKQADLDKGQSDEG